MRRRSTRRWARLSGTTWTTSEDRVLPDLLVPGRSTGATCGFEESGYTMCILNTPEVAWAAVSGLAPDTVERLFHR